MDTDKEPGGTVESATTGRMPPYISFQTLLTFLKALKTDGLPPQIDKSVLSRLSGGVQNQMKMALRALGLMEGDKPTDSLESLVNTFETPEFEQVLLQRLKATYPYVFDLDLMTATPTMFADAFKVTGAKEDVSRKCRTFFMHAAKRAGVEMGPRLLNASPRATPSGATRRKTRTAKAKEIVDPPAGKTVETISLNKDQNSEAFMGKLLDKFPELDPSWPDDIKAKWFASFEQFMKAAKSK